MYIRGIRGTSMVKAREDCQKIVNTHNFVPSILDSADQS